MKSETETNQENAPLSDDRKFNRPIDGWMRM